MNGLRMELKPWFAKKQGLKSNKLCDIEIIKESTRAYQIQGLADFVPDEFCWRCGQHIEHSTSRELGVGPTCADILGIPWKSTNGKMGRWLATEGTYKGWIPKSVILSHTGELPNLLEDKQQAVSAEIFIFDHDRIGLHSGWVTNEFVKALKNLEGRRWHPVEKINSFDLDRANYQDLVGICQRWKLDLTIQNDLQSLFVETNAFSLAVAEEDVQGFEKIPDSMLTEFDWSQLVKTTPWEHQQRAMAFISTIFGLEIPKVDQCQSSALTASCFEKDET